MPALSQPAAPLAAHPLRYFVRLCWLLLGLVFIFSGLVKLNDPVGTGYKLEEYFEVFATDLPALGGLFEWLKGGANFWSITLSALEVILGGALLLRWYLRQTLWALLGLLGFFTFLTFYSAYFKRVTDCGCFGDLLKLSLWGSFAKNLVLLGLWVVVFPNQRFLRRRFLSGMPALLAMTVGGALVIGFGVRALGHLPYVDLLPYKVGNNIARQMKAAEAPRYRYTFERNGQTMQAEQFPTDTTWQFKQGSMELLNPATAKAPITDFLITDAGGTDVTAQILTGNKLLVLVQNTNKANRACFEQLNQLVAEAAHSRKHVEVVTITSSSRGKFDTFRHEVNLMTPFYFADATVLKTMLRANPGLLVLHDGTVVAKYHYHDIPPLFEVEKAL